MHGACWHLFVIWNLCTQGGLGRPDIATGKQLQTDSFCVPDIPSFCIQHFNHDVATRRFVSCIMTHFHRQFCVPVSSGLLLVPLCRKATWSESYLSCQTCRFHDFPHYLQMNAGSLTSYTLLLYVTGVDFHPLVMYNNLTILFDALMDSAVDRAVAYNCRFILFSYFFIHWSFISCRLLFAPHQFPVIVIRKKLWRKRQRPVWRYQNRICLEGLK